jgi:limonene 1,2-monooxygenase
MAQARVSSERPSRQGSRCSGCGTRRSAELFAAEVIPHFQGQAQPTLDAATRASDVREDLAQTQPSAIDHMTKKYEAEKGN